MKKLYFLFVAIFALNIIRPIPLFAQDEESHHKQRVLLLPVNHIVKDDEFAFIKRRLYSTLKINLGEIDSISFLNSEEQYENLIEEFDFNGKDYESLIGLVRETFGDVVSIFCEYYVSREELHILVYVRDPKTMGIKYSFVEFFSADSEMLANIEEMAARIAGVVARELPPSSREVIIERQVPLRLRLQIDEEEKLLEKIFDQKNELQLTPLSGVAMGRTVVSWSNSGPFVGLPLGLEYSLFFNDPYHIRGGVELLLFDQMEPSTDRIEFSAEILFGWHSRALESFSLDAGLAVIWDHNTSSQALSDEEGISDQGTIANEQRVSFSIPLQVGMSHYLSPHNFANVRFKYSGLTYTIEPLVVEEYERGHKSLKYENGFSVLNLLSFSIIVNIGWRF